MNVFFFFVDVDEHEAIQLWGEGGGVLCAGKFSVTGGLLCLFLLLARLDCLFLLVFFGFFCMTFFTEPFTS